MKNILNIERARRINPDDMMSDVEFAEEAYERLAHELMNPPTLMNHEGEQAVWAPPDSIEDLSDSELEQAIWQSARIYGHFAKVAESSKSLLSVVKEEVDNLAVILYSQYYPGIPKSEIKGTLASDTDYRRAGSLKYRLTYLHGEAEGNRKDWSKLSDRLSRIVELRKDDYPPQRGGAGRRVVKSPKKIFRKDDK